MHLDPSHENVLALIDRAIVGPVVMLNLLRFKTVADYSDHPALAPARPITGRAAYDRYIEHTLPFLHASGGEVVLLGTGGQFFVGPNDERWDLALMIRQASIESLFAFASNGDYMAGVGHRTAAVEDTRILPIVELSG